MSVARRVLGVDGCPTGWVVVVLEDGVVAGVEVVEALGPALERHGASHVGIDMPVGLVDGLRDTDAAARRELPGRAATVFSTAPAAVVDGYRDGSLTTHAEASACCRRVSGQGLSQQAWRLVPKLAVVDALVAAGAPLHEVHPELAFATVAGGPMPRKRSWPGLQLRRRLLAELGLQLPDRFPGDVAAAPDDVVDAAVCAWVADGLAGAPGAVRHVPERTEQRAHGRPIVITVREQVGGRGSA
jgi:predicted RNase H-like nuclease